MLKTRVTKGLFSNVAKIWELGRPCSLNISKHLCSGTELKKEGENSTPQPRRQEDGYLYLDIGGYGYRFFLLRLNISELCASKKPNFEVVLDRYYPDIDQTTTSSNPSRKRHVEEAWRPMIVGSTLYKFWAEFEENLHGKRSYELEYDYPRHNFKSYVYSYDLTSTEDNPRLCDADDDVPKLIDPDIILGDKLVLSHEDRTYVLNANRHHPPLFKVFDPRRESWRDLPHPPSSIAYPLDYGSDFENFAFGDKLYIETRVDYGSGARARYTFDTKTEEWQSDEPGYHEIYTGFGAIVEFQGFLIGLPRDKLSDTTGSYEPSNYIVAWRLDSNGMAKRYRTLHDLHGAFSPYFDPFYCFMGHLDGRGRMWLVYNDDDMKYIRVAVFQISVSDDGGGDGPTISARLEAAETYGYFPSCNLINSASALCHHVNRQPGVEMMRYGTCFV